MDESDIEMAKICFCHPMHVYSAKNIIQVDHSFFYVVQVKMLQLMN